MRVAFFQLNNINLLAKREENARTINWHSLPIVVTFSEVTLKIAIRGTGKTFENKSK